MAQIKIAKLLTDVKLFLGSKIRKNTVQDYKNVHEEIRRFYLTEDCC